MKLGHLLCALICLAPAHLAAQEADEPGEQVRMKLEHYARLLAQAKRHGGPHVAWDRAQVRVQLPANGGDTATVSVTGNLLVSGEGEAEAVLLPAEVVLQQATIDGRSASLMRVGGAHVALLQSDSGQQSVSLTYLVPVRAGDDGAPAAMVPLPPLPGAALTVTGDSNTSVWPAAGVSQSGSTWSGSLPATSAALIRWGGGGSEGLRRIDYVLTPDAAGDGLDVDATYEVQAAGTTATFRLARASAALTDVREGNTPVPTAVVDGWHTATVTGRGRHVLKVGFRLPIDRTHGNPQVSLTPDNVPMARVQITVPGKRDVSFEPPVPLKTTVRGEGERASTTATGHLPPLDEVAVRWTEARVAPESQVRYGTETYQLFTLAEGVLRSTVTVRYDVIYGKLKDLPIALPDDVIPYKVTGEAIEDWRVLPATEEAPRQLRIALGQEMEGKLALEIQLERAVEPKEGTPIDLPIVRPMGAFRELGVVALFDGDKVGFAPAVANGFTKVGQDALPPDIRQKLSDKVNQAFKHVGEPGTLKSEVATAKAREIRFDARVDTLYLVRERSITGHSAVLVELKSGRSDKLVVSLPADVAEPRITAPSLNKVEPDPEGVEVPEGRRAYEVRFTQALEGAIQLDVEFEHILPKELGTTELPAVLIHGSEVESGSFGIAAETGMEVQPGEATDLRRVEVEALPKAVRLRSEQELRLGYHYAHVPWSLKLDIKRHRTVETLNAVGRRVWLESNVLDLGKVVTRATYEIENDDRQFLRLKLPPESSVLRVTANGRKVKAVADESGAIAIRLHKGQTVRVEITYELDRGDLGVFGRVALVSPEADLRTSDIQWFVRVPREIDVFDADTDLKSMGPYAWEPPTPEGEDPLPTSGGVRTFLFTQAVADPQVALDVGLRYAATPGPGGEMLLFLLALVALVIVTRRRAKGAPMGGANTALLLLGVALLVVKAMLWSLEPEEGFLAIIVLVATAWITRRQVRKEAV